MKGVELPAALTDVTNRSASVAASICDIATIIPEK